MNAKILEFTISDDAAGTRLDRCLSRLIPGSSRSYLQKLIKDELVCCNGQVTTLPRFPVKNGMVIKVAMPEVTETEITAGEFDFEIIFEDRSLLVINKPAGTVVHPAAGNPDGTVVNALLGRYPEMAETFSCANARPGIVHRLDKDTSGCLAIAKTPDAQFKLGNAFAGRETGKTYLAICRGTPAKKSGELQSLIGRHPIHRQKMAVVERNGKLAITTYQVIASATVNDVPLALLKVNIATGRTHQIRVHLASIRLPILGDMVYGRHQFPGVSRQMLHAWKLELPHPASGERLCFKAQLPADFITAARLIVPDFDPEQL